MDSITQKIRAWYRGLPDKKRYVEFFTAILTVPVLITVIIANVRNLNNTNSQSTAPSPEPTVVVIEKPSTSDAVEPSQTPFPTLTPAPVKECAREVGPAEIIYPAENSTVTASPVCIDISYAQGEYCSVVWSYRINGSAWSDYSDKSFCLYGLEPGVKKLEVRVKSIASGDEKLLTRTFTLSGNSPTPEATGSGISE